MYCIAWGRAAGCSKMACMSNVVHDCGTDQGPLCVATHLLDKLFKPGQSVGGTGRMHCADPGMPDLKGLEHIQGGAIPDFPHDDSIWGHPEKVFAQIPHRDEGDITGPHRLDLIRFTLE